MRGIRIQNVVNELGGERIDVVQWDPEPSRFVANALSPAQVVSVVTNDEGEEHTAEVVVPDRQLSLAIGKEGQNARLAAKLTGWRIDIKSQTAYEEELAAQGLTLGWSPTGARRSSARKALALSREEARIAAQTPHSEERRSNTRREEAGIRPAVEELAPRCC
jgi:N utilization substance protein A